MASPTDQTLQPADGAGKPNHGNHTQDHVDRVASEVAASKEMKEQAEAKQEKKEGGKKDSMQTLKSAIIVSGIVVAVVGAAFAITKKLREK